MAMGKERGAERWQPPELITDAEQLSLAEFARRHETPFYLAVQLEDLLSELAIGLENVNASAADRLSFRTTPPRFHGGRSDAMSITRALEPRPKRTEEGPARLEKLLGQCCYFVPVRKRSASFASFISLGRTRNHDIVLRDPTVSKLQATLELVGGQLFVRDAGSRNGTLLNQSEVSERKPIAVGDSLRFGDVECLVCSPASIWQAVHRVGPGERG
jgi:hypothetical protein